MIELTVGLMIVAVVIFVILPFFAPGDVIERRYALNELQWDLQKEALYAAIREIDADYRMDKLEEDDWKAMRLSLLERLVHLTEDEKARSFPGKSFSLPPDGGGLGRG